MTLTHHHLIEICGPENELPDAGETTTLQVGCNRCHGHGEVLQIDDAGSRSFTPCPICGGSGKLKAIVTVKFERI
jgi:DnaJ-class molecular chaperone